MMSRLLSLLFIVLVLILVACSNPTTDLGIVIQDAWVRAAVMFSVESQNGSDSGGLETENMNGSNSAAYMVIRNDSNQMDRLIKVESEAAKSVELHLSEMVDDVMSMRPVDSVEIPANGQVELKPGSYHIMLVGITQDLNPGDNISFKLTFEKAGIKEITADVRQP